MGANNTDIRIAADQIKHTVTMRQICDMYGVKVNRNNKALCPCHADTNASMHIYSGSRGWYCFSCGKGGSVIDYVMAAFGCDFQSAVRKINQDFGLGLDLDGGIREDPEAKRRIEKRKAEKAELEAQLAIEMNKQVIYTEPQIRHYLISLRTGDLNDINIRRGFINIFVRAIYLYDDKMTIYLNSGDKETVIDDILIDETEEYFDSLNSDLNGGSTVVASVPPQ